MLTLATADVLLTKGTYAQTYYLYAQKYRDVAWGGFFYKWAFHSENPGEPYNSFGNGSAMRVAPIGWFFPTIEETLVEARNSAMVTHNHSEGIKGAQAVASATFLGRTGQTKTAIKKYVEKHFGYNLTRSYLEVQENGIFNETCKISVPEAIICFL